MWYNNADAAYHQALTHLGKCHIKFKIILHSQEWFFPLYFTCLSYSYKEKKNLRWVKLSIDFFFTFFMNYWFCINREGAVLNKMTQKFLTFHYSVTVTVTLSVIIKVNIHSFIFQTVQSIEEITGNEVVTPFKICIGPPI